MSHKISARKLPPADAPLAEVRTSGANPERNGQPVTPQTPSSRERQARFRFRRPFSAAVLAAAVALGGAGLLVVISSARAESPTPPGGATPAAATAGDA